MRRQYYNFLIVFVVLCIGLLSANVYAGDEKPAESQAAAQQGDWEFDLAFYVWMPDIEGTTPAGDDFEITFSDILDNLDMTLMTTFGARKDKWTLMTDVIYLDLNKSDNTNIDPLLKLTDLYLKTWIVSPFVSYEIIGGEKGSLQLLAGARYLWIEVGLDIKTRPPLDPEKISDDGDGDVWDGIVGVRGYVNLTDRWFMPYRFDVGTGDSDKTWQAMGGIGYKFDKFKLLAIYRYMKWDFGNDSVLDDLKIYGPMVGAKFTF